MKHPILLGDCPALHNYAVQVKDIMEKRHNAVISKSRLLLDGCLEKKELQRCLEKHEWNCWKSMNGLVGQREMTRKVRMFQSG